MYDSGISEVDIIYRPGKNFANADALSRSPQSLTAVVAAVSNDISELLSSEVDENSPTNAWNRGKTLTCVL